MPEWKTNRRTGKPFMVKETASNETTDMFDSKYGWVDKRTGIEHVSEDEIVKERRERRAQQREEERSREYQYQQNKEEAQTAAKQNERSKKPRRKAIGNYTYGDVIELGGKKYKVFGQDDTSKTNSKPAAWYVEDENGKYWKISRFGDITEW